MLHPGDLKGLTFLLFVWFSLLITFLGLILLDQHLPSILCSCIPENGYPLAALLSPYLRWPTHCLVSIDNCIIELNDKISLNLLPSLSPSISEKRGFSCSGLVFELPLAVLEGLPIAGSFPMVNNFLHSFLHWHILGVYQDGLNLPLSFLFPFPVPSLRLAYHLYIKILLILAIHLQLNRAECIIHFSNNSSTCASENYYHLS